MRIFVLFFGLIFIPVTVFAFDIEDQLNLGTENASSRLRIISTTDVEIFQPILEQFVSQKSDLHIEYVVTGTTQLMQAIADEKQSFDVAISSAMDLQTKLANDGLTLPHTSATTDALPDWARWREDVFAFTQEPAAIVLSRAAFDGLDLPQNREDLIAALRRNPETFRGKIGTYDLRTSGLGYLFATQDSRMSEVYWRLTEVMGALEAKLYSGSGSMLDDVASGDLTVAYNVLGSYALSRDDIEKFHVILPTDFTTVMLRTALIPSTAENLANAEEFIDFLVTQAWRDPHAQSAISSLNPHLDADENTLRRIRLGPGLLIFLDTFKRRRFLSAWESAIQQE